MRFRAAVLHGVKEPLRVEAVELARLEAGDVLIRNHASGLCHTDLEVIEGSQSRPLPIVLGHEGAGVVEDVGAGVTSVRSGDHVVASWNPHCGHCFYCERDQPVLCEPFVRHQAAGRLIDGRARLTLAGSELRHFGMVSSHAEYSVIPESGAIAVPRELAFDRACLLGCGVMTGVGAVIRVAKVRPGATDAVLAEPAAQALDAVKALTAGRGADYVFECAGSEESMRLAFEITRPGGELVILGKTEPGRMLSFRYGSIAGEKRMVRSSYGGARPRRDFPWLAGLYLDGKLELDALVTARMPLEDVNAGFDAMRAGKGVRTVLDLAEPLHSTA